MIRTFWVEAEFDHDAGVWYVSDSDVPGLATEAISLDQLMAKLKVMIPDLFDARGPRLERLARTLDDIRTRYGQGAITRAGMVGEE